MTKLTDLNRANEALPAKNVRCHHQNINPEQLCYVCKGENDVVDSLGSVHLEVDVEEVKKAIDSVMPCNCIPAYKDRLMSAPDCPNCNYKDDLVYLFVKLTGARLVSK